MMKDLLPGDIFFDYCGESRIVISVSKLPKVYNELVRIESQNARNGHVTTMNNRANRVVRVL